MAMTDAELTDVARELARRVFVQARATAHSDLGELKTAIANIDTAMSATTTQANALYPGDVIESVMLGRARVGAPNLTVQQAGVALALWSLRRIGLL